MNTALNKAIQTLRGFIGNNELLQAKFDEVARQIQEENRTNVRAMAPVGRFRQEEIYIGNMNWIEDYEIDTYTKTDDEGNEWESEAEYEAHVHKKADETFSAYKVECYIETEDYAIFDKNGDVYSDGFRTQEEAEAELNEMKEEGEFEEGMKTAPNHTFAYCILDEDGDEVEGDFETEDEAKSAIQEKKETFIEEAIEEYDDFDTEYHEIYWNYVYQYNGDVNVELAKELGLGVLSMNSGEHEGEQFLFLRGCGMDLSPKLVAYKALEYGYIDEDDVYKLETESNRDYFRYVVGTDMYERVLNGLNLRAIVQSA